MIIHLLLHEPPVKRVRRTSRVIEYLLLFAGLIAIDCCIWVNVEAVFEQAYGNWSLDRQIAGRPLTSHEHEPPAVRRLPTYALIGRVEVPRLGLSAIVREGVDSSTLRTAVGHMPSTPLPGQPGNSALAAHRDTLFRELRNIRKDDRITIETVDGTYNYVVESLKIVNPSDVGVLKASSGDRLLTLITCYPFNYIGAAPNRFIVRARAVDVSARTQRHPIPTKS